MFLVLQLQVWQSMKKSVIKIPISGDSPIPEAVKYKLISTETLGGAANAFTSITIPATCKIIDIYAMMKLTAGSQDITMQFNADGGANYLYQYAITSGAAASGGTVAATTSFCVGYGVNATNWYFVHIRIINNATTLKNIILNGGKETSCLQVSGHWNNTNAITGIVIAVPVTTFIAGSIITAYGHY
jgi:hypothetical protein